MSKPKSPAEKAVERFEAAQGELNQFIDENEALITELRRLIDEHNAALKEAQLALKTALRFSDDDKMTMGCLGVVKKKKEVWDGMLLASSFPAKLTDYFLIEHIEYEVNVPKLEQLIRQGEIDRDKAYEAFQVKEPIISMTPGCPKELIL